MEKYFNINYEFSPQEVGRRIDEQLSKTSLTISAWRME